MFACGQKLITNSQFVAAVRGGLQDALLKSPLSPQTAYVACPLLPLCSPVPAFYFLHQCYSGRRGGKGKQHKKNASIKDIVVTCVPFVVVLKCLIYFPPSMPRNMAKSLRECMLCLLCFEVRGSQAEWWFLVLSSSHRQAGQDPSAVCVHHQSYTPSGSWAAPTLQPRTSLSACNAPSPELSRTAHTLSV